MTPERWPNTLRRSRNRRNHRLRAIFCLASTSGWPPSRRISSPLSRNASISSSAVPSSTLGPHVVPGPVVLFDPCLVGARGDVAPPLLVVEVPVHGAADAVGEIDMAAAAELAFQLARIDGVAMIVAGTISDERDQRAAGFSRRCRAAREAGGKFRIRGEGAVERIA